jgi:RND superfamily putative drug exporter
VIAAWLVALLVAAPVLPRVEEPLKVGGFSAPGLEAARAREVLETELGFAPSTLIVLFRSDRYLASDPEFNEQVRAALANVGELPHVTEVLLPQDNPGFVSADGDTAYAVVGLDLPPEEAQRLLPAFEAALAPPSDLSMLVAGAPAFYADIETASQRDLRRAELIAFPVALLALLLVFGSVVAAVVPLAVGGAGVAVVLLALFVVGQRLDLSIFVLNLATMLGLGLAVDYSLFVTSRFREELAARPGDVAGAIERTVATAGRAVFFSGLTVLIGLTGLTLFSFMFLRSVGVAGVIVVLCSVPAALTLLPAILAVVGTRIDWLRVPSALRRVPSDHGDERGPWAVLARWVMAHPLLVLAPTLAILLLFGAPFLRANISSPDATILPGDLPSRQAFDILVEEFGPGEVSPFLITLTSPTSISEPANLAAIADLTRRLAADPRIARVQSIVPSTPGLSRDEAIAMANLQRRLARLGLAEGLERLATERATAIIAYSRYLPNDERNKALLRQLRAATPRQGDLEMLVDGGTAEIVDSVGQMYRDFPRAAALVVAATYLVLLVLFRSVVLPLKAIVMNLLSILASYGALVWVFQEGHLSRLLGFTPVGFVDASLPVVMFCILFGLSMDYEVFLLTRVREEWERSHDNARSVAVGLERSGRIITSAALIVVVVTASFVTADVILIKALGLGIAVAVFLDATIVRALLVPATMRLLGEWNWWAPGWIRRRLPSQALLEEAA